jgi:hypothetical protein
MRVLASNPPEMIEYGVRVFFAALTTPELAVPPLAVALAIGILGAALLAALHRRSAVAVA